MRSAVVEPSLRPRAAVRLAALGGVVGPAMFVGAWVVGAATTNVDYSSVHGAISRLAAVDADSRTVMTAGFIGFGVGLPLYATALYRTVDGPAWLTAAITGVATLAVAATPLDHSSTVDTWHGLFATVGYLTLAATPLLAVRPLRQQGHRLLAMAGVIAGTVSATSLSAHAQPAAQRIVPASGSHRR